jgi:uncharacterized protein YhbP (UPF0306 family)
VTATTREIPLRDRIAAYLRAHHTMTLATAATGPDGDPEAHAASVFYAVDSRLRLVFVSKPTSRHGAHILGGSRVAATVTEESQEWREIQGVQLWGRAEMLSGAARARGMALYLRRFPFVRNLLAEPRLAALATELAVFRVTPECFALTDNRTGFFGREVL